MLDDDDARPSLAAPNAMLHLGLLLRSKGFPDEDGIPLSDSQSLIAAAGAPPVVKLKLHSTVANVLCSLTAGLRSLDGSVMQLIDLIERAPLDPRSPHTMTFLLSLFQQAHHILLEGSTTVHHGMFHDQLLNAILLRALHLGPPAPLSLLEFVIRVLGPTVPLTLDHVRRVNEYLYSWFPARTDDLVYLLGAWLGTPAHLSAFVAEYGWSDVHTLLHTRLPRVLPIVTGLLDYVRGGGDPARLDFLQNDGARLAAEIARRLHRGPAWAKTAALALVALCKQPVRAPLDTSLYRTRPAEGPPPTRLVRNVKVTRPTVPRAQQPVQRKNTYPPPEPRLAQHRDPEPLKPEPPMKPKRKPAADAGKRKKGAADGEDDGSEAAAEAEAERAARRAAARETRRITIMLRRPSTPGVLADDQVGAIDLDALHLGLRNRRASRLPGLPDEDEEDGSGDDLDLGDPAERGFTDACKLVLVALRDRAAWIGPFRELLASKDPALTVAEALLLAERIHALLLDALNEPLSIDKRWVDEGGWDDPADDAETTSGTEDVDWDEDHVDRVVAVCLAALRSLITHMRLAPPVVLGTDKRSSSNTSLQRGGSAETVARPRSPAMSRPATGLGRRVSLAQDSGPAGSGAASPKPVGRRVSMAASFATSPATAASPRRAGAPPTSALRSASKLGAPPSPVPLSAMKSKRSTDNLGGSTQLGKHALRVPLAATTLPPLYRQPRASDPNVDDAGPDTPTADHVLHHAQVKARLVDLGFLSTLMSVLVKSYAVRALHHAAACVQVYSVDAATAGVLLSLSSADDPAVLGSRTPRRGGSAPGSGAASPRGMGGGGSAWSLTSLNAGGSRGASRGASNSDLSSLFDLAGGISSDELYGEATGRRRGSVTASRRVSLSAAGARRASVAAGGALASTPPAGKDAAKLEKAKSKQEAAGKDKKKAARPKSAAAATKAKDATKPVDPAPVAAPPATTDLLQIPRVGSLAPSGGGSETPTRSRSPSPSPSRLAIRIPLSGNDDAKPRTDPGSPRPRSPRSGTASPRGGREERASILGPLHVLRHSQHMALQRNARAAFWSLCRFGGVATSRVATHLVRESVWEKLVATTG
ncbi:hypothetical protein H9P43_001822 [Blastocladiella emersonii ATCC 22665]|nr:hypothetical protein H9P43_001822 [Blastocladiella emersonii ATCC 22665]